MSDRLRLRRDETTLSRTSPPASPSLMPRSRPEARAAPGQASLVANAPGRCVTLFGKKGQGGMGKVLPIAACVMFFEKPAFSTRRRRARVDPAGRELGQRLRRRPRGGVNPQARRPKSAPALPRRRTPPCWPPPISAMWCPSAG